MTHTYSKQRLRRFLNSCTIISASMVLIAIVAVVVTGMRVHVAGFPESLGNSSDNIGHIKSATDPNEFTFIVVGDVKGGIATFEAMLEIIQADKPAFGVILGDFVGHTKLISHKLFAMEMAEHARNFPMLIIPGNHDISTEGPFRLEDFENTYGPAQFSFTIGKSLFVFLNVISPYGQTGQYLEFLEQAITGRTEKMERIFVFMHIPPSGLNSSLMCNELPESEKFLQLTKKYHIDYVFAGDHHGYVKTKRDGTTFIVTGGGGARLRGKHGKFHHLMRMSVKNGMIDEAVIATKRQLETSELMERNIVVYIWPLIARNSASVAVTFVIFSSATGLLIFSLFRRKRLEK